MTYISFDPWLQKENGRFENLSDDALSLVVDAVYSEWSKWRKTTINKRKELLESLGNILMEEKNQHALTITSEMGKVITQSLAEIDKCASLCFYYANNLDKYSKPDNRASAAGKSTVFYEPQGVILGIMPWNFPYWQAMRFIVPVIAGGNSVLLKHASNVPFCAQKIEKTFIDSGFPANICHNIFVSYEQIEKLIERPEIRGISLTGSNNAGKRIAESAGRILKKTVLELGGSDPFIILSDADLDAAADAVIFSRFQNCGQSCIAAKRLYVQAGIFDTFLLKFTERVNNIIVGDPYRGDTFIGPMVSEKALSELNDQVLKSISMGGRIISGGSRLIPDKPVFNPTVIADVPDSAPIICEEVFGPVIPVIKFTDIEDVIKKSNRTSFGLGASVWTKNTDLAMYIASEIDTGTVAINGFVRSDPALPFGGVKDSGYGRELSMEGFREFLNIKAVTIFR